MNQVFNIVASVPRTPNNQLDTSEVTIQTQSVESSDICVFFGPLVTLLNEMRLADTTGFKDA